MVLGLFSQMFPCSLSQHFSYGARPIKNYDRLIWPIYLKRNKKVMRVDFLRTVSIWATPNHWGNRVPLFALHVWHEPIYRARRLHNARAAAAWNNEFSSGIVIWLAGLSNACAAQWASTFTRAAIYYAYQLAKFDQTVSLQAEAYIKVNSFFFQ